MNNKNNLSDLEHLTNINNELYEENTGLKSTIEELKLFIDAMELRIKELESTVTEKDGLINELQNSLQAMNEPHNTQSSPETADAQGYSDAAVSNYGSGVELASTAIGSVVMKCSEVCSEFAEFGGSNAKDLVNLALGRTEVFKSEALSIIEECDDINVITTELQEKMNSAFEYFELLKRQI